MSQLSKAEKKQWKKRVKSLTPEQYKSLIDENKGLKGQVAGFNAELSAVDAATKEKEDQVAQYEAQMRRNENAHGCDCRKSKRRCVSNFREFNDPKRDLLSKALLLRFKSEPFKTKI